MKLNQLAVIALLLMCVPGCAAPRVATGGIDKLRARDGICASVHLPHNTNNLISNMEACARKGAPRTLYDNPNASYLIVSANEMMLIDYVELDDYQITVLKDGEQIAQFMSKNGTVDHHTDRHGTLWYSTARNELPFRWVEGIYKIRFVWAHDTNVAGEVTIAIGDQLQMADGPIEVEQTAAETAPNRGPAVKCSEQADCKVLGQCTASGNRCIAGSDSDCKKSELCRNDRKCTALAGECIR
jgi:hypothetical protein